MPKKNHNTQQLNLDIFSDLSILGGKKSYISLFSSAGVGCYGFDKNVYECIATNELLPERLAIQRANKKCRYENGYVCGDIKEEETKAQLFAAIDYWKRHHALSQVDVVFATPPCQGMSTANYKKTEHEQSRNSLVVEAIKLITEIKPKVFVFENVRAFLTTICTDLSGQDMTIRESIWKNLGQEYHIYTKVINFKDYGVPSSRPRTIVIGTLRSLKNVSPLNLFPSRQNEISLRQAIGSFPRLSFSQKDSKDFLHFARPFPEHMLAWIENLAEGQSAFEQEACRQPHRIGPNGEIEILKGSYMGNKYRRLMWDRPCSCIATRNDQLASQDTIHPSDNRVLSIRELMRLMTIPDSFRWTPTDVDITPQNSGAYLKRNELNIRRCIGEAVPTEIIRQISSKISDLLDYENFVGNYAAKRQAEYLCDDKLCSNFYIYTFLKEKSLTDAKSSGSFYTPQSVVFDAIKDIKPVDGIVRILEPAAGLGAFLPQICSLFSNSEKIIIDAVEISEDTISTLREALSRIDLGTNVEINLICEDFMRFVPQYRYNLVVSNPPYGKIIRKAKYDEAGIYKTKNLFALFMAKFKDYADDISCIIPKNFAIASEYFPVRKLYEDLPIVSICDYGVKYFKDVFIEILSIHFSKSYKGTVSVTNYLSGMKTEHAQGYIYHHRLWLLYRSKWFDEYIGKLNLDCFDFIRDRQITNSHLKAAGKVWVVKSKNILDDGSVVHIPGYDKYIDNLSKFHIGEYYGTEAIIMPNFTYNTRAAILPPNSIPNGSIAILIPKKDIDMEVLKIYSTPEFREYYAIVKSYSKFTINIDNSSIYYIGVPNGQL